MLLELTRSSDRHAVRFHPIADRWREAVSSYRRELAETAEERQEIESPYVIGIPLTEQQELFVGRTDVSRNWSNCCLTGVAPRCCFTASGAWARPRS